MGLVGCNLRQEKNGKDWEKQRRQCEPLTWKKSFDPKPEAEEIWLDGEGDQNTS